MDGSNPVEVEGRKEGRTEREREAEENWVTQKRKNGDTEEKER